MKPNRVPVEIKVWVPGPVKAGTFLKLDGKTVGRVVEDVPSGNVFGGKRAKCEIDVDIVDKMGDNSGGFPKVSFLITRD